jgi:large subunit ribosomal protein L10
LKKEQKAVIIDGLQDTFAKSKIGVLTNYRGLKTKDLLDVRKKLKDADGKFVIAKNTLARSASEKAGMGQISPLLNETTAIAFGFSDIKSLAVAITEYVRMTKTTLTIKGGYLGDKLLTTADITRLTTLPSREQLLAQLLGQLNSPIATLMAQLNAPLSGLVNVLNARKNQLEGEAK